MHDTETLATSRRAVLAALFALCAVPKLPATQPSPILGAPKPKFWFGDRVSFCWFSDDDQIERSESGDIIGVCWHPLEKRWEYSVVWTDSTKKDPNPYPIFDERLTLEKDLKA